MSCLCVCFSFIDHTELNLPGRSCICICASLHTHEFVVVFFEDSIVSPAPIKVDKVSDSLNVVVFSFTFTWACQALRDMQQHEELATTSHQLYPSDVADPASQPPEWGSATVLPVRTIH